MKHHLLILSVFFLSNCSTQKTDNQEIEEPIELDNEQTELANSEATQPEKLDIDFESFLVEFSNDEKFQIARVAFPLNIKLIDIEDYEETVKVNADEWQHENLLDTANIESRDIDAYSQQLEMNGKNAKIKLRGIDNGIWIDYKFKLKEGRWYLTDIFNGST
jgi:hypothetical protein